MRMLIIRMAIMAIACVALGVLGSKWDLTSDTIILSMVILCTMVAAIGPHKLRD